MKRKSVLECVASSGLGPSKFRNEDESVQLGWLFLGGWEGGTLAIWVLFN